MIPCKECGKPMLRGYGSVCHRCLTDSMADGFAEEFLPKLAPMVGLIPQAHMGPLVRVIFESLFLDEKERANLGICMN